MDEQLCVICGEEPATTRDHVPPKGIFCKPRPDNLITVPACANCNNGASALDEAFLVNLGLHVSTKGSEGERLFNEKVLPALKRNQKKLAEVLGKAKRVELTTPAGIVHGEAYASQWDSEAHDSVLERMVRGLTFHHYGEILGKNANIQTHFFNGLNKELYQMSEGWAQNSMGDDKFIYKYTSARKDDLFATVWVFQFYGGHWAGAQTKSKLVEDA
jgi:hypothetical protein